MFGLQTFQLKDFSKICKKGQKSPKIKATWTFINVMIWQKRILFYSALLELGIFFYTIETRGGGNIIFFCEKRRHSSFL